MMGVSPLPVAVVVALIILLCDVVSDVARHHSPASHSLLTLLKSHTAQPHITHNTPSSSPHTTPPTVSTWTLCPLPHTTQLMDDYERAYHPSTSSPPPPTSPSADDDERLSRARFRAPPAMAALGSSSIRSSFPELLLSEAGSDAALLRLSVYELRFDAGSGQWWLLCIVDRVYGLERGVEHMGEAYEQNLTMWGYYTSTLHGVSANLRSWQERGVTFYCLDEVSGARVAAEMDIADHWLALSCPFPLFPLQPPATSSSSAPHPALQLHLLHPYFRRGGVEAVLQHREEGTLHLLADPAFSSSVNVLPPTPTVSIALSVCHRRQVLVAVSHCAQVLYGDEFMQQLLPFMAHHAYSGVERFHVYDRHGVYYPLLLPYIRSGLVEYEVAPARSASLVQAGRVYVDQALFLEKCRWSNAGTSEWATNVDYDEWLAFPPSSFIAKQPSSCFTLQRSPSVDASNPYAEQHHTLAAIDRTRPAQDYAAYYSASAVTLRRQVQARPSLASPSSTCSSMLLTYLRTLTDRSLYQHVAELQLPVQLNASDPRPLLVPPATLQAQSMAHVDDELPAVYSWWVPLRFHIMVSTSSDDDEAAESTAEEQRQRSWETLLQQAEQGNDTAIALTGMRDAPRWRSPQPPGASSAAADAEPSPSSPSSPPPSPNPRAQVMTEKFRYSLPEAQDYYLSWKWCAHTHHTTHLHAHADAH